MAAPNDPANLAGLPAGKAPPGVIPNFANPYTDGPTLIAVGGVFTALALIFVAVRIYTKLRLVGKWSPDDSEFKCKSCPRKTPIADGSSYMYHRRCK